MITDNTAPPGREERDISIAPLVGFFYRMRDVSGVRERERKKRNRESVR